MSDSVDMRAPVCTGCPLVLWSDGYMWYYWATAALESSVAAKRTLRVLAFVGVVTEYFLTSQADERRLLDGRIPNPCHSFGE